MARGHALFASSLLAAFAPLATGRLARADSCHPSPLTSTCINDDTFWPHAGPSTFAAVGGTETTGDQGIGFGLVTDYLSRPLIVHVPSPGPGGSDQYVINDQVSGTFLWSYGVTKRLELDLAIPITFGQGGTGISPITASAARLQDTAVRDIRFGATYSLLSLLPRAERVWGLTARFEMSAPTGDQTQYAGDRTAVFVPSLAADYKRGRWFAGAELGVRARGAESVLGATVGTQAVVAMGVGYDLLKRAQLLGVMVEARALPTFASQQTVLETPQGLVTQAGGSALIPSEWMLSVRSSPLASGDFAVQAGGGGPIPFSDGNLTVPRFRFMLGLRFTPGAYDRDHDGVADELDHCPDVAAKTRDGCPAPVEPAKPDAPHLDLSSALDRCKDDPDTVDGFKDTDGCPDEDSDHDGIDDRYDKCPNAAEDYSGVADGCPQSQTRTPVNQ